MINKVLQLLIDLLFEKHWFSGFSYLSSKAI